MSGDGVIAKLNTALHALAEAKTLQDVKRISDLARAAEVYAKQQKLGDEAIGYAHSIKIEALRRLGEMLKDAPKAKGGLPYQERSTGSLVAPVETLAESGIDKKTSAIAQKLAALPAEQFQLVREGASTITKAIREVEHAKRPSMVDTLSGKYRVIYADPPWTYGNSGLQNYGHASFHYPTLTIDELCAMPVADISEDNAVLFLWVTSPLLEECFTVINSWGFRYKASFVWDKVRHNMGHYNSVRHEFLLVCTKGSCTPDVKELFDSVQSIERTDTHSEKPREFRAIIEKLYPHGKRIELFARTTSEGWHSWGNEP